MSKGKDNRDDNPFLNKENIKHSVNNELRNEKCINLGEIGVPKTFISKVRDKKSKEKKNDNNETTSQNSKELIINNNINKGNIYYVHNQIITNNDLNNKVIKIPNPLFIPKNLIKKKILFIPQNKIINKINKISNLNKNPNNDQNNQITYPLPDHNKLNIKEDSIFSKYKKVPLNGLGNLGNTSYLNSVLQLFCNIMPFKNYLLSLKNKNYVNVNLYPLLFAISNICTNINYNDEHNIREIYSFKKILGFYNIIYEDCQEKNPNEFIVFLLDKLNDELSLINNNYYNDNFIYNYFTWIKMKEMKCPKYLKYFRNFQNFQTFDLNIIDVFKYKKLEKIKIRDCIDFYNNIPINKKSYCDYCEKYEQITANNKIYFFPEIFIFLLDLMGNKNINFIIEQRINLSEFIENKKTPLIYKLNGIVFFDTNKKKYNALCASPFDKNWYLYDDENVQLFKCYDFINSYNKYKIHRPYILVYNKTIEIN